MDEQEMKRNPIKRSNLAGQKFLEKWRDRLNWAKRSMKRVGDIFEVQGRNFSVRGRDDLGDEDRMYWVWYDNRARKYKCSCYSKRKRFGRYRERHICTHVGAVILHRMSRY